MSLDKKVAGKSVRWVLLADVGKPVLRSDVPLSSWCAKSLKRLLSEAF